MTEDVEGPGVDGTEALGFKLNPIEVVAVVAEVEGARKRSNEPSPVGESGGVN